MAEAPSRSVSKTGRVNFDLDKAARAQVHLDRAVLAPVAVYALHRNSNTCLQALVAIRPTAIP